MQFVDAKHKIIDVLNEKSKTKALIFENTKNTFKVLNQVISNLADEYSAAFAETNSVVNITHQAKSEYESELQIGSDLLIFNMHSNIFDFDKSHKIWESQYVQNTIMSSYVGIISIFNFLSDSFRYNRADDVGYLIGRIFINKDRHFFIEGKRQLGFLYDDFSNSIIDTLTIRRIVESAILYTLDFDLLVPPYDKVKSVTVAQIQRKMRTSMMRTGKRVGYKFYIDEEGNEK